MPPKQAPENHRPPADEDNEDDSPAESAYQCTACEEYIKTTFDAFMHPMLKCLVCRKCHTEYKTGDFSEFPDGVDENGVDNFCRWCTEGGQLFLCSNHDKESDDRCTHVFCEDCVRRNVPDDPALHPPIDGEIRWICYACDPSPLKELRRQAQEAIVDLSQKNLKRTRDNPPTTTTNSQHDHGNQRSGGDRASSTNGVSSRKDSETTPPPESSRGKVKADDKTASSSTNRTDKDLDESSSERKKRRMESSSSTPSESERRDSSVKRESSKKREEQPTRDPESTNMPPLERPRQPVTSLRATRSTNPPVVRPSPTGVTPSLRASTGSLSLGPPLGTHAPRSSIPTATVARSSQPPGFGTKQPSLPANTTSSSSKIFTTNSTTTATSSVKAAAAPTTNTTTIASTSPAATTVAAINITTTIATTAMTNPQPKLQTSNSNSVETLGLMRNTTSQPSLFNGQQRNLVNKGTKGLKSNSETIRPTTKVRLSEQDLKARLDHFGTVKDKCVEEINIKYQNIIAMFTSKELDNKLAIKNEIEDLEGPLQEFNTMLINLKSLYSSQN